MIEVERKLNLTAPELDRLLKGSESLGSKEIHDIYYDTKPYTLTVNDVWLRNRNGQWELKDPKHAIPRTTDQVFYDEIEEDVAIANRLNLPGTMPLKEALEHAGYEPVIELITHRTSYKRDPFRIDVDETNFDYRVVEIELMAEEGEEHVAAQQIKQFLADHNISSEETRGKLIEYLFRVRPEHAQAMIKSGVIMEAQQ